MSSLGGYDDGYDASPCFWGREPSSLVRRLIDASRDVSRWSILDAGCGEGKNAIFLSRLGAKVRAIDVSAAAIRNARRAWEDEAKVTWEVADIRSVAHPPQGYDLVIAYGMLHCLPNEAAIQDAIRTLQRVTRPGGYDIICAFNNRSQDLAAHPSLHPTLLSHDQYLAAYSSWRIIEESDRDLSETHPTNDIPHTHSMTRLIARRSSDGDSMRTQ